MRRGVYLYDRLVVSLEGTVWRERGDESDRLSLVVTIRNTVGAPGSVRTPPHVELRDGAGRVYESQDVDWSDPMEPCSEFTRRIQFEIPSDADDMVLVIGPGQPEEVHAPVRETSWSESAVTSDTPVFDLDLIA